MIVVAWRKLISGWRDGLHVLMTSSFHWWSTCLITASELSSSLCMESARMMNNWCELFTPTMMSSVTIPFYSIIIFIWHKFTNRQLACIIHYTIWSGPQYLVDDVQLLADSSRRLLQSANYRACVVPRTQNSFDDRAFSAARPKIWNNLPPELRHVDISFGQFINTLKSYLFRFQSATAHYDFLIIIYLLTYFTILSHTQNTQLSNANYATLQSDSSTLLLAQHYL